jgi:hypothetical protein
VGEDVPVGWAAAVLVGLGDVVDRGLLEAPGVGVLLGVWDGVDDGVGIADGVAVGLGSSSEVRGSVLGGSTTTPTTSRDVKLTKGLICAVRRRPLDPAPTDTTSPIGTPGT